MPTNCKNYFITKEILWRTLSMVENKILRILRPQKHLPVNFYATLLIAKSDQNGTGPSGTRRQWTAKYGG